MTEISRARAVAAVAAGGVIIGLAPIGLRLSEIGPQATAFWRFLFALPALGLVWRFAPAPASAPKGGLLALLVAAGMAFGGDIALWHASLKLTTVVNATLFSNMTPIVAALIGWAFLKERISWGFALGAGAAVAGAAALALSRSHTGQGSADGDALALGSAFWYALYLVLMRSARRAVGVLPAMVISTAAAILVVLPAALILRESLLPPDARGWLILAALGLFVHAGGQGLIAYGIGQLPIALSTVLLWLQPLAAAALSWMLFGEALAPLGFLGAALLLLGIWIVQTYGRLAPAS